MKFCQLKEYNMRNILLEKSFKISGGETIPRPFSEKPKLSKSLNQQSKTFVQLIFIVCQVEGYQNMLKLSSRPLAFISY